MNTTVNVDVKTNKNWDGVTDPTLSYSNRVYNALKVFPEGLSIGELKQFFEETKNKNTIYATIFELQKRGNVVKAPLGKTNDQGHRVSIYKATNKVPAIKKTMFNKKPIKNKEVKPTPAAINFEAESLKKKVEELLAWKAQAIKRFPDLAVHPLMLEARKRVAKSFTDCNDHTKAKSVIAGECDNSPIVKTVFDVLNEVGYDN